MLGTFADSDTCYILTLRFNVNIKRNLIHKSTYLRGSVNKFVVKAWLNYLQHSTLYKQNKIQINWDEINTAYGITDSHPTTSRAAILEQQQSTVEEHITDANPDSDVIVAAQQTLLWNEESCLNIAPGQRSVPLNLMYDKYAEELSFPAIYYGEPRKFKENVGDGIYESY